MSRRIGVILCLCSISLALAERTSQNYTISFEQVGSGGQRISSANYTIDESVCDLGGSCTSPLSYSAIKSGYIAQVTDVTNLAITAANSLVNEGESNQLGVVAGLDDGSASVIPGAEIIWLTPVYPIDRISTGGLAFTGPVDTDTVARVSGHFLGITGAVNFLVCDTGLDNYGFYGGDGLPDGWQAVHFGLNNPNALTNANPDADGYNNAEEYIAGTDPTDSFSYFHIAAISNVLSGSLIFFKAAHGRRYTLLCRTNLTSGSWAAIPGAAPGTGNGSWMWLSDTNNVSLRFYRVKVEVP